MSSQSVIFEDDVMEEEEKTVHCLCKDFCPSGKEYGTCETKPGGKCFTAVEIDVDEDETEYPIISYGCLPPNEMALFQCRATLLASRERKTISCCDKYDFCNKHMLPVMPKRQINWGNGAIIGLGASVGVCLIIMAIGFFYFIRKYENKIKKRRKRVANVDAEAGSSESIVNLNHVNNVLNVHCSGTALEMVDRCNASSVPSSISGISLNGLSQVTISGQMQINNLIGKGKFGEVFKAKWRGERVAVKIFYPTQGQYWLRESEIYQTVMMRHENVLGYVAADIKAGQTETQMLLITQFHRHGSLHNYLKTNTLSKQSLLRMCRGIASGLNYLHAEIFGVCGKPAIAVRTLKSPNILVKSKGDCCISDFGSAVKFLSKDQTVEITTESKLEPRYQAPEIMDKTMDTTQFESYKMADIYSFSLILWEMCRRTQVPAEEQVFVEEHQSPYEDLPKEEIEEFVCVKKMRPEIPGVWRNDETMKVMTQLIEESWNPNPMCRLTSLRIKKTLFKIDGGEGSGIDT